MKIFFDSEDRKDSFQKIGLGIWGVLKENGFKRGQGHFEWIRWNGWKEDRVFLSRKKYGDVQFLFNYLISLGEEKIHGRNLIQINVPTLVGDVNQLVNFPKFNFQKEAFVKKNINLINETMWWFDLFESPDKFLERLYKGARDKGDWSNWDDNKPEKERMWLYATKNSPSYIWTEKFLKKLISRGVKK